MDLGVTFVGLLCGVGGGGILYAAASAGRKLRSIRQTCIADLRQVPQGSTVLLRATVACDQPLEDPSSGDRCIYFQASVSMDTGGDGSTVVHKTVERAPAWALRDDTGSVRVECEDFAVDGGPAGDPERVLRYYALAGRGYLASSCHIPVGHQVFVEGQLSRGDDGERVLTGPGMTVDGRSQEQHRTTVLGLYVLGALLLVVGSALTAAGIVASGPPPEPVVREGPIQSGPFRTTPPLHKRP